MIVSDATIFSMKIIYDHNIIIYSWVLLNWQPYNWQAALAPNLPTPLYFDHLVVRPDYCLGSLSFLILRSPLLDLSIYDLSMSTPKHHFDIILNMFMYYRYLGSEEPSFELEILDPR
jgi:hypothetical protein